jgi:UDP-2,3-diacylglucosamine pyrophosphatase LpxH
MDDPIELESLYVISDLHLGGREGFQIFGSTDELAWLIDQVASPVLAGTRALLINGDFIDFLAEEPSLHFDPDGATAKLDGVWSRFQPVFDALGRLLTTPQRLLIVNLGNHDLELALPWVRAHLTARLAGSSNAARAQLRIVTDGTGVRCCVGSASVLCVHGNEVDSWNVADYERLRQIGRNRQFGLPVEAWRPNAGARMVVEVINEIKRRYPFVDLLKPETAAVLPILAALNPAVHRKLLDLASIAGRKAWDVARMAAGFLEADAGVATNASAAPTLPAFPAPAASQDSAALLDDVESAWRQNVLPISLVRGAQDQKLGFWNAARDYAARKPTHEVLRQALEYLDRDGSFDPTTPDATFRDLDAMIGPEIDLVIAGHTHLERSLARRRGRGHYFNTGTWARLIRVKPEVRQDPVQFEQLFRLLDGATMQKLDAARIGASGAENGVVLKRNSVVIVEAQGAGAPGAPGGPRASLHHVIPGAGAYPTRLEAVTGAQWTGG